MKIFILASLLALAACGPVPTDTEARQKEGDTLKDKVHLVTLKNGMPCAIYEYVKSGGLSCDWDWKSRSATSTPVQTTPVIME